MLHRASSELTVRYSHEAKPTVEVSGNSLTTAGLNVVDALFPALRHYAKEHPAEHATLSLYGTMSTNFNELGWSEFIVVDGSEALLIAVAAALSSIPGAQSRYSDYVAPTSSQPLFHIEEGSCYQYLDAITWGTPDKSIQLAEEQPLTDADDVLTAEDEANVDAVIEEMESTDVTKRGRLRVARSDASVGTIRRTIERMMGLPEGSVALCGPDKRPLRSDATIGTLRNRWE